MLLQSWHKLVKARVGFWHVSNSVVPQSELCSGKAPSVADFSRGSPKTSLRQYFEGRALHTMTVVYSPFKQQALQLKACCARIIDKLHFQKKTMQFWWLLGAVPEEKEKWDLPFQFIEDWVSFSIAGTLQSVDMRLTRAAAQLMV